MREFNLTTSLSKDYVNLSQKMKDLGDATVEPGDMDMLLALVFLGILFTSCLLLW